MDSTSTFWLLVRYGIVGVIGGALQTISLYVWVNVLHLETQYLFGAVIGFCVALAATFTLQKYWTFRDRERAETQRQFLAYTGTALIILGLNVLLLHLSKLMLEHAGLDFFNGWYLFAQIIIIMFLAGTSFAANYFITFRARRSVESNAQIVSDERA